MSALHVVLVAIENRARPVASPRSGIYSLATKFALFRETLEGVIFPSLEDVEFDASNGRSG